MTVERDEAGNTWATAPGDSDRFVIVGGHLDSVPNGGWLDGTLNVVGGLEVLRALAPEQRDYTLKLVDWADEEGARFGRSLLGSSACAGTLDPDAVRGLTDRDGTALPDALAAHGVELDRMKESGQRLDGAIAYLELHIEQGPVLEQLDLPLGAVLGTFGVQRHLVRFTGAHAHAGASPMHLRRDAFLAAARSSLAWRDDAAARDDVRATTGIVRVSPGIVTAFNGTCEVSLDQRALDPDVLADMLQTAKRSSRADRRGGGLRRRVGAGLGDRADPVRPGADRPGGRRGAGGEREQPPAAERAAARRRGDGARDAHRDALRQEPGRRQPHEGGGHAGRGPRAVGPRAVRAHAAHARVGRGADRMSIIDESHLSNKDLAPTGPERRTWGTYNLAALWVGLSIVITTYTLAAGLIAAGMSWWQGLLTVALGNLIVLVPILLNSHPGTKYGIPFPVLVRSSFGIRGANVAAMARALVACGWFGIQTWIGALALDTLMTTLTSGWADISGHKAIAFAFFWALQVAIILRGIEGIKFLESYAAPILIGGSVGLLIWGFGAAGNVFSASSQLIGGDEDFWTLFGPGLAANVGYWITLSMNIPDFTRYAKDQRSQIVGQSIAMPLTMTGFSFIGIAVTCATVIEFGEAIWDPVTLVARLLDDLPILLIVAMIVIVIAQISTNMAANVVSPSNDFSNLSPRQISFRTGGLITAVIGIISFPWKLYEDVGAYIFTWLVGYGSLLAVVPRGDGVRLLAAAAHEARRRGALSLRPGRTLLVLQRVQLARARRGRGGRDPRAAGLPERGDDRGRRGRRSRLLGPALPLRRVRRVRALRGHVRRAEPAAEPRARHGDGGLIAWTSA